MKRWIVAAVAGLVAGCVSTPAEMLEAPPVLTTDHKTPPSATMACLRQHLLLNYPHISIDTLDSATGTPRVLVRENLGHSINPIAILDATPIASGTQLVWRLQPFAKPLGHDEPIRQMILGPC